MSLQYPANIWQSSTTTGTGTLTLSGSSSRLRTFQAALGSSAVVFYMIAGTSYFEFGRGAFSSGSQALTRDEVFASSNAGSLVNLPSATHDVYVTFPGEPLFVDGFTATKSLTNADHGNMQEFTGSSAATLNLQAIAGVPFGFQNYVRNGGTANLTLDPNSSETIEGAATLIVGPSQAGRLYRNATEWRFLRMGGNLVIPHTWSIGGEIKVASGDVDYIPPMFFSAPPGQTIEVVGYKSVIGSGASATVKLQKNGSDLTGFTGISVTTTPGGVSPTAQALADGDALALVVTGVSGTPKNITFTVFVRDRFQ